MSAIVNPESILKGRKIKTYVMSKEFSSNSIIRMCPQCQKAFRPMTNKKWNWVYFIHTLTNKRPHIRHHPFEASKDTE